MPANKVEVTVGVRQYLLPDGSHFAVAHVSNRDGSEQTTLGSIRGDWAGNEKIMRLWIEFWSEAMKIDCESQGNTNVSTAIHWPHTTN